MHQQRQSQSGPQLRHGGHRHQGCVLPLLEVKEGLSLHSLICFSLDCRVIQLPHQHFLIIKDVMLQTTFIQPIQGPLHFRKHEILVSSSCPVTEIIWKLYCMIVILNFLELVYFCHLYFAPSFCLKRPVAVFLP